MTPMTLYRFAPHAAQFPHAYPFWEDGSDALEAAKALARNTGQPVLVEVNYEDDTGWHALKIEGLPL